ncbi:MAG: tetratricopeptide repeat protein [Acidobacteriota bacterium]
MRTLSFIFVCIFAVSISAQSSSVTRPFNDGTRSANAGKFEKALSNYLAASEATKGESIDRNYLARLHYNLGVCEFRLGQNEQAVSEFDQAIQLKGDYPRAHYALGMAESTRQNWSKARLAFLEALRSNRANGEVWFDLAFAYLGEKDVANAETAFRNSIANKSVDSALGHNNVGVLLAIRGDLNAAEKEFEAALRSSDGKLTLAQSNLDYCRAHAAESLGVAVKSGFAYAGRTDTML